MKILIISVMNGQVNRGVESWTSQILCHLLKAGENIRLIQGGNEVPPFLKHYSKNIDIVEHSMSDLSGDQRFFSKVKRRLGIYTTDVEVRKFYRKIENHIINFNPDVLLSVSGELKKLNKIKKKHNLKAKMIVVGHAGVPRDVKYSDVFIALSDRDKNYAVSSLKLKKVYRVNNGVDTNLFSSKNLDETIAQMYASLPKPIILCVSALVPYKRVHLLIDAYELLKKGSLIIIGDGPDKEFITEKINKIRLNSKENNIRLLSHVPFSDMPSYFNLANIFVHPADSNEAFGSVIVEAMAMGKTVIVNNDDVRRNIVSDLGYCIDPSNVKVLRDTIEVAFNSSKDKTLITARKQRAMNYSWEKVVKDYLRIFREVIS